MEVVVDILKHSARPPSVTFLVAVLAVGVILALVRRTERMARGYVIAVFLGYWVLSTPACAERLVAWSSDGFHPIVLAADARGATVVVVLGAGNENVSVGGLTVSTVSWATALRVVEGARLYGLLNHPMIILSGGTTDHTPGARPESEAMRDAMLQLGVSPDHLLMESESKNTHEEAITVRRMIADSSRAPIVIVTSPTHMRRSIAVFQSVGLDAVPSACAYKSDHSLETGRWLPSDLGLRLFDSVVYDNAAWWYYRARGWVPK